MAWKLCIVKVILLLVISSSVESKRRKHYTSSSYLDSYQFPDQRGFQQPSFRQPQQPDWSPEGSGHFAEPDFSESAFAPGLNNFGSRFDFEGSGSDELGSGDLATGNWPTDDEDFRRPPRPPIAPPSTRPPSPPPSTWATVRPDFLPNSVTSELPLESHGFEPDQEGSGEGSGGFEDDRIDDEDFGGFKPQPPTIPVITVPTTIKTTSAEDDITFGEITTTMRTTTTSTTTPPTTKATPTTTPPPTTTTTAKPRRRTRPTFKTTPRSRTTPSTTVITPEGGSNHFGPNSKRLPTPLFENRLVVIIIFCTVVFCLLLGILFVLCVLIRYHKRPPSEASSDTASSDLPMIKADAKRYNAAQIRQRAASESPPPLPDLNLFDEPAKFDRKGSIRKSKREVKNTINPNWL